MGLGQLGAALAGLATGAGNEYADLTKQEQDRKKYQAMQEAILNRQSALEDQKGLPKSLYGPLWEKTTGQTLPADAPERITPMLGSQLFQNPYRMGRNDSFDYRTDEWKNRGGRGGGAAAKVDPTVLANIEAEALKAGRNALGGKVPPDLTALVGPQRDAFNQAFKNRMAGAFQSYGIHQYQPYDYLQGQPAVEGSGLHGMMGFGSAPVPERSTVATAPWATPGAAATGAVPVTQQAPQGSTLPPPVQARIRALRQNGSSDAIILQQLQDAKIPATAADLAAIQ